MKKPKGFIARCQCDNIIGAMDYNRTERKEAGKILGEWLAKGCTVEPVFESSWSTTIKQCNCKKETVE